MSDFRKIYSTTTQLKFLEVSIDDHVVIDEEIISLEIKYDFFNLPVEGTLKMKDSFDINNSGEVSLKADNKITVSMKDIADEKTFRTFRITAVDSTVYNERFKMYSISFVDEFSYQLMNTFASKSFNDTPINSFLSYLTEFELDKLLEADRMSISSEDNLGKSQFVVPQDRSVIDFFLYFLKAYNIRIWQDRYNLNIKEVKPAELTPIQIDGEEVVFSNNIYENMSKYKIHDFEVSFNRTLDLNVTKPKEVNYKFEIVKSPNVNTINLEDEYSNLKLNSIDLINLQQTTGNRFTTQTFQGTTPNQAEIFDIFMGNNILQIVVPAGIKEANIGNVVKLDFKGNPAFTDSSKEGDELMNGYYFITGISDLITGENLIHRYTLNRIDLNKPRKMKG
jgi:hypothetical protein